MSDEQTPEFYRQRYFALKEAAKTVNTRPARRRSDGIGAIPASAVLLDETIPGGWYWTGKITKGSGLRLVNTEAGHGISMLLWNAKDISERYNPADSIKVQWTARLTTGKLLLSDMGRAMMSVTGDTCGIHDHVAGGSTPESNNRNFGHPARNAHENFILAAGKHGMGSRDVGPCVTFFAPVVTDNAGKFLWKGDALRPAQYVDLRAEMDLIVALSNTPHPLSPMTRFEVKPMQMILWNAPPAAADDLCRTASEEAVRAFENNEKVGA